MTLQHGSPSPEEALLQRHFGLTTSDSVMFPLIIVDGGIFVTVKCTCSSVSDVFIVGGVALGSKDPIYHRQCPPIDFKAISTNYPMTIISMQGELYTDYIFGRYSEHLFEHFVL